jgi:hypothetical protein|tara:strand:+ start:1437 stop:1607 length:171 start_codon:yes stop_codon:yes gene_type:complete
VNAPDARHASASDNPACDIRAIPNAKYVTHATPPANKNAPKNLWFPRATHVPTNGQ